MASDNIELSGTNNMSVIMPSANIIEMTNMSDHEAIHLVRCDNIINDDEDEEDEEEKRWISDNDTSDIRCCCCCLLSGFGLICWNIFMVIFNILTSLIFIFFLILIYSSDSALMAYAITMFVMRTITNCAGFVATYILRNKQWNDDDRNYRNFENFLFFYGISILLLTIIFDITFLVFFNFIITSLNDHPYFNGSLSSFYILNIVWIIDIIHMISTISKYFKYTNINPYFYKHNPYFYILLLFYLSIFIWGICQIINSFIGSSIISVHERGYSIEYYVGYNELRKAKQMQSILVNNTYIVYVCCDEGVYALIDWENDQKNDEIHKILPSIERKCSSIAIDRINNILYITEYNKIYKCDTNDKFDEFYINIHQQVLMENNITSSCKLWFEQQFYAHHGWHITNINPQNNHLCISMGAHCNICLLRGNMGNIWCFNDMNNPSFLNATIMATGTRDVVGFIFDEYDNNTLWFTDHNVDGLGDNLPDCELNKLSYIGENFGFPFCHSLGKGDPYKRDIGKTTNYIDPLYGININNNCSSDKYTPSIQPLGPHVAPNGLIMVKHNISNNNNKIILIAEHGSWNRAKYIGYRIAKVVMDNNDNIIEHSIFVDGWLNEKKQLFSGRPVHLNQLYDGSILISDNVANTIYRVYYDENNKYKKGKTIKQSCIGGHINKFVNWLPQYHRGESTIHH